MFKNEEKTRYYLGIDWGQKRCGLAIVDDETRIASSKGECEEAALFDTVKSINEECPLEAVVFGFSEVIKNEDCQKQMEEAIEKIQKAGLDVHKEEEMFSTLLAQKNLAQTKKKGISKEDNVESARIILQGWIDKKL